MPCLLNKHCVEALGFFKVNAIFASLVISSCRLLMFVEAPVSLFLFRRAPGQSRNSGVEELLLIKIIIKEISDVNSGEE